MPSQGRCDESARSGSAAEPQDDNLPESDVPLGDGRKETTNDPHRRACRPRRQPCAARLRPRRRHRRRPRARTGASPSIAPTTATCGSMDEAVRCRSATAGRPAGCARRCRTTAWRWRRRSRGCRARTPFSRRSCCRRNLPLPNNVRPEPPAPVKPEGRPQLPDDAELNRMMNFIEKVWRRLVEMIVQRAARPHEEDLSDRDRREPTVRDRQLDAGPDRDRHADRSTPRGRASPSLRARPRASLPMRARARARCSPICATPRRRW